ncbi:MAG TPA: hypothetical protein ENI90_09070 [Methylothermaceae bacterium]|nr:hypothetical protein [Methylothermaceae bacterium]
MKKGVFWGLILSAAVVQVWAEDSIGGVPVADFQTGELRVSCVEVKNLSTEADGQFFDVIFQLEDRATFKYVVKFAAVEDPNLCRTAANFAKFEDQDLSDDRGGDGGGIGGDDGTGGAGKILVICEKRAGRSKISVNGKNLPGGSYKAVVKSGGNQTESPLQETIGDEVEFDFDSDPSDIGEGATPIAADFIQESVSADLVAEDGTVAASIEGVACLRK